MNSNTLHRLEAIILNDISEFIAMDFELDKTLLADFRDEVTAETERIKNGFMQAIYSVEGKRELRRYIQYHQQALFRLAGQLANYTEPQKLNTDIRPNDNDVLSRYLYASLEELLTFVQKQFSEYFNLDIWIPENYRLIITHDIRKSIKPVRAGLLKRNVDTRLVDITLQPFRDFMEESSSCELTYRKVIYLKTLKKELLERTNSANTDRDGNVSIQSLLLRLNFNTEGFIDYSTDQFRRALQSAETAQEKVEKLALIKKSLYQTHVKPGLIYDPDRVPVKDQLLDWITRETDYLNTQAHLLADVAPAESVQASPDQGPKIPIDLSVAQFTYLIRIFVEVHVIQSKNIARLVRLLSRLFQTRRSGNPSHGSMLNKYYNVESSTREAIRKLLLKMADHISRSEGA